MLILYFNMDVGENAPLGQTPSHQVKSRSLNTTGESSPMQHAAIDVTQLDWPRTLARDPFAPMTHHTQIRNADDATGREGGPERGVLSHRTGSPAPPLQLTAVTLKPEPKLAMINRRLVVEGDDVEGLEVTHIASDGVWLDGPLGSHHLVFDSQEETRSPTIPQRERSVGEVVREERRGELAEKDT